LHHAKKNMTEKRNYHFSTCVRDLHLFMGRRVVFIARLALGLRAARVNLLLNARSQP
jgi:hypothetical protein